MPLRALVVLALGRHRRAETDVDDDPAAGEQDRAGAVAVGAQEGAAVGEERQRQQIGVGMVRAAVIVEAKPGDADAELPERLADVGRFDRRQLDSRAVDHRPGQRHLLGASAGRGAASAQPQEHAARPRVRAIRRPPHDACASTSRMLTRRRRQARTVRPRLPIEHEVVERLEHPDRRPDRRSPVDVAGEQRDQRLLDAERILRRHEELAHRRVGDAEDEPRELARAVLHVAVEGAAQRRRVRPAVEHRLDDVGAVERALHREVDARREDRVDEGIGVADHEIALAAALRARVRVVAGRVDAVVDELGAGEALLELGAHRDRVAKELGQRLRARLQVIRPADRADAGRAVGQGNEPEPAVLEPEDRDVAFELAGQPLGAGEMAVERRAVVALVLLLAAKLVGEQSVASGSVDDETGAPAAPGAVGELDLDVRAVAVEGDLADALAFERARALAAALRNRISSSSERRTCQAYGIDLSQASTNSMNW